MRSDMSRTGGCAHTTPGGVSRCQRRGARHTGRSGDAFAAEVVGRRAESALDEHGVGAGSGGANGIADGNHVVGDDDDAQDEADAAERLAEPGGVGVDGVPGEKLVADTDDRDPHAMYVIR